jgi:hypothetical protein
MGVSANTKRMFIEQMTNQQLFDESANIIAKIHNKELELQHLKTRNIHIAEEIIRRKKEDKKKKM